MGFKKMLHEVGSVIFKVNWMKTIYFNLKYFPLSQAVMMPCFIYWHSCLRVVKGEIQLLCPARPGLIRFGTKGLGTVDVKFARAIWEVRGRLIVHGKVGLGLGTKISIGDGATLELGSKFVVTGNSAIVCQKDVRFGEGCLLSWDILVMDTDFHKVMNEAGEQVNEPAPIVVGDHVWIGCRNTILKGVSIANNTIVAADSLITRSFTEENTVIGGRDGNQRVIKRGASWKA